MNAIKCLVPTLILFCLLDFLWIGWIGKSLYITQLGHLLNLKNGELAPRLIPAIFVYFFFSLMIWCVVLNLSQGQIINSFLYGALLGAIVYGIYDMTNMSVLKEWPWTITLIDLCWGTFLCSVSSGFCAWLYSFFQGS